MRPFAEGSNGNEQHTHEFNEEENRGDEEVYEPFVRNDMMKSLADFRQFASVAEKKGEAELASLRSSYTPGKRDGVAAFLMAKDTVDQHSEAESASESENDFFHSVDDGEVEVEVKVEVEVEQKTEETLAELRNKYTPRKSDCLAAYETAKLVVDMNESMISAASDLEDLSTFITEVASPTTNTSDSNSNVNSNGNM